MKKKNTNKITFGTCGFSSNTWRAWKLSRPFLQEENPQRTEKSISFLGYFRELRLQGKLSF